MKPILPKGVAALKCYDDNKNIQSILAPPGTTILVIPANVPLGNATFVPLSNIKVPTSTNVITLPHRPPVPQEESTSVQDENKSKSSDPPIANKALKKSLGTIPIKKNIRNVKFKSNTDKPKVKKEKRNIPENFRTKDVGKSGYLYESRREPSIFATSKSNILEGTSASTSTFPIQNIHSSLPSEGKSSKIPSSDKTESSQNGSNYKWFYSGPSNENLLGKLSDHDSVSELRVGSPPSYESHIEGSSSVDVPHSNIGNEVSIPPAYHQSPHQSDLPMYSSHSSNVYSVPSQKIENSANIGLYPSEHGSVPYNSEVYDEPPLKMGETSCSTLYCYDPSHAARHYDAESRQSYYISLSSLVKDYSTTGPSFDATNFYIEDCNDNEPRDYSSNSTSNIIQRKQATEDCIDLIESFVENGSGRTLVDGVNESSYEERRKLATSVLSTLDDDSKRKKVLEENFWIVEDEPLLETSFLRKKQTKEELPSIFKSLNSAPKPSKEFICHICGKMLKGRSSLRSHIHLHLNLKPYECQYCSKKFTQSSSLKNHLRIHTGETPYSCTCGKAFKTLSVLRKHSTKHSKLRSFKCCVCFKGFKTKVNLQTHLKIHMTGPHLCQICKTLFDSRRSLSTHVQRKHKSQKKISCTLCHKSYGSRSLLKQHMNFHSNEMKHSCYVCGASYVWKSGLAAHLRTHSFRIQCEICGIKFISLKKLEKHRSRHSEPFSHKCSKCDKQFKFSYLLKKHVAKHKDELSCTECGTDFMTKTKLKKHLKIHTQNSN